MEIKTHIRNKNRIKMLTIKKGSENYAAQVIKLPAKVSVKGLDNLVQVTFQGNNCLINRDADENILYLFIPSGAVLNPAYLSYNNLYKHTDKNMNPELKGGFFGDHGRVKAMKFKGIISTGYITPLATIDPLISEYSDLKVGDTFTTVGSTDFCWKYAQERKGANLGGKKKLTKIVDEIVDSKMFPEHTGAKHLLKSISSLSLGSHISLSVKLHGTSVRASKTPIKRKLSFIEKIAKKLGVKIQETEYAFLVGSRKVLKSVNGETLGKKGYYATDIWSKVAVPSLMGYLNDGEAVYGEIIGSDGGTPVQKGYAYGLDHLELYIYRITNINSEGIEVDLSWEQMKVRAEQLGVKVVPDIFEGRLGHFIQQQSMELLDWDVNKHIYGIYDLEKSLENIFYNILLEKPSVLNPNTKYEEGFVLRLDTYPKATALKIKSRNFLAHESKLQDQNVSDTEEEN